MPINWSRLFGEEDPYEPGLRDKSWNEYDPNRFNERFGSFGQEEYDPYDFSDIREQRQRQRQIPEAPIYDYKPMEAYRSYLEQEPEREQYQPKGWGRILNAATAGLEGYRTGSPAAGLRLGQQLNEEPYRQAYEGWQNRGQRIAKGVELENARFNQARSMWNQEVDNLRQQEQLEDQQARTEIMNKRLDAMLDKQATDLRMKGYKPMQGQNGFVVMTRVGPDGKLEEVQTNNPNDKLTAAEQQANVLLQERGRMTRSREGIAAANTRATLGREQSQEQFVTRENRLRDEQANRAWDRAVKQAQPATTSTPKNPTDVLSKYKDFASDPDFVRIDGRNITMVPKSDAEARELMRKKAKNDADLIRMAEEWGRLRNELRLFVPLGPEGR